MLALDNVSKSFGPKLALAPTSLIPARGRTTVLLGPSGCGKSTLLRLMVGLVSPDAGRVLFDGVELSPANIDEVRHRIGYVIRGRAVPSSGCACQCHAAREISRARSWLDRRARWRALRAGAYTD
jgi:ABC-type proline/glycine betaine transport system ATPase subunit